MEHEFTKQEIFGLYLNVIFFGQRAYGVAAAAEAFFGKTLDKLDVAEAATIAGAAQGALALQPDRRIPQARHRRAAPTCCGRMRELGYIDAATAEAANKETDATRARTRRSLTSRRRTSPRWRAWSCGSASAPSAESAGYKVYTTIDGRLQADANRAVRIGLIEYDRRHGWRGPAGHVELPANGRARSTMSWSMSTPRSATCSRAVVLDVARQDGARLREGARLRARSTGTDSPGRASSCATRPCGPSPKSGRRRSSRAGDVVYVVADGTGHAQLGAGPRSAERTRGARSERRQHRRAGRRVRLLHQQVQPRDAGAAPARLGLQALPVLGGARARLHAGERDPRRPDRARRFRRARTPGARRTSSASSAAPRACARRWCTRATSSRSASSRRSASQAAIDYVPRFGFDPKTLPHDLTLALGHHGGDAA